MHRHASGASAWRRATTSSITASGVDAPAATPTRSWPASHAASSLAADSTWCVSTPCSRATSARWPRVRALAAADDDHQVDLLRQFFGRCLLARRRVAERVDHAQLADPVHVRRQQRLHEVGEMGFGLRRLREHADARRHPVGQRCVEFRLRPHRQDLAVRPAEDAAHFLVLGVAEDDHAEAFIRQLLRPLLRARDDRAGRVDDVRAPRAARSRSTSGPTPCAVIATGRASA